MGDIMAGLKTVVELTGKVERLERNVDKLAGQVDDIDRRLVRIETVIEITRSDGATLRIGRDPENKP
ncbi:hypothetical protein C7I84_07940 [Mesorhizobium ephedrae]|uniref:Uncharacterized protein n=1 Tax=Kumtagia ephedrae TaxID=2116701 RepID=A0A2P7SJ82_9HYPH|nr:hypothetical protein C7I84_07940 [Mesorhizobium ephedrae]